MRTIWILMVMMRRMMMTMVKMILLVTMLAQAWLQVPGGLVATSGEEAATFLAIIRRIAGSLDGKQLAGKDR